MQTTPIIVMTGATSGIGELAAMELAKQGAHLVLTARSEGRAEITRNKLEHAAPNVKVDFFYGDLSLMEDVKRVGNEIKAVYSKLDVLVNNAGLHGFEQRITAEGLPEMIAVNYLAPWLLTDILLPSLMASQQARIVNVASEASRNHGELKLPEDLTDTAKFSRAGSSRIYGKTKLLNIMFTGELARRLEGTGVTVNALNPGFNVTGLGRELGFSSALASVLRFLRIGNPQRGAGIILQLVTASQYQGVTGGYFNVGSGQPIVPVHPGGDPEMQSRLWSATEELLGQWIEKDENRGISV
ncbi:SDR family NAD(P)-dependent oxidoreductase [Paenibacillus macerans]|uniref:SDR family NAD(P)-dependent oxidoreductase n=1 Tax=Paenibacillus macerans TaxID=44252 RepID=UPI00203EF2CC|nr:SDR family NAD(P)-dependent oxidoreductase [Paenibacillus macerans]MCM3699653.1 SDR family NAD(P)-dependent oxidoreductase [Paenibacillus macerans]